ncbi:flagellar export protein FliJ [Zhongshania aquimaris]|uniref:Flagellar export protein FliJ n=1 Tax=Zhongshania aquimaris TaxID=2857107 RepID=A0ABS6VTG3_9GAMM|nr:flagellar export protein FliJ [Zhongshania aquimaris]MBW2941597.1 flagellar export protein FliJ [Zhongshania aquimaris]
MKKSKRMQTVNSLAERNEREQADKFSSSQRHCEAQKNKLDELKQYYQEYADASRKVTGEFLDLRRLQESRAFMAKLSGAIAQQREILRKAELAMNADRKHWMDSRRRAMSMQKLTERYVKQELYQAETTEQRVADDLSSQRFVWSMRQSNAMA